MRIVKILLALLIVSGMLRAGEITIAVAANVSYAIDALKEEFGKSHPDVRVKVILGSSGKLTAQIRHGAPYGLFMAANMTYPEALYRDGIALSQPVVYAEGALAMLSVRPNLIEQGMTVIADKRVRKIAIANPKTAPYGMAAVEAIGNSGLLDEVRSKFVYGESISQTVSYTVTATDIGFIAKSSLFSPKMAHFEEGRQWVAVNPDLYTPIKQGIVLLRASDGADDYRDFYEFMRSAQARVILKQYGYIVP
jgi:molybdate transport system substrate-binding protein